MSSVLRKFKIVRSSDRVPFLSFVNYRGLHLLVVGKRNYGIQVGKREQYGPRLKLHLGKWEYWLERRRKFPWFRFRNDDYSKLL